jgi:cation:H+ antiporter
MLLTVMVLIGSILLVFVAALLFVNVIEWLGCRFNLGRSFVGAILAPLFTSFPELVVILVAVFSAGDIGESIGVGTIFGEPFMASSLSYGLVGIAVIIGFYLRTRKGRSLRVDKTLAIPYIFIMILFPLTLVPSFIPGHAVKYLFAAFFFAAYVLYLWLMFRRKMAELIEESEETYISKCLPKNETIRTAGSFVQLLAAIGLLYWGSKLMVGSVSTLSESLQVSPMGLALIIVPAATAIPETISAIIWGYRGKDTLALGALVGEKILFSTFYPALGMLLTAWTLDIHTYLSVVATTVVSLILLIYVLRTKIPWYAMLSGLAFFVFYAVFVFVFRN